MRWLLHAFLQGLLNPAYGNVVFSRSKLHALHKSLVFFRSLLLPPVANLMFCVCFLHVFVHLCVILWLRAAVCGREFLSRVDILMQFLRWFLRAVSGNVVFFRRNVDAHHKSLVFFRSFLPPAVAEPMFCVYLFAYFADICVVLRCALQSVACSSWVELVI